MRADSDPTIPLPESDRSTFMRLRDFVVLDRENGRPLARDLEVKRRFAAIMAEVESVRARLAEVMGQVSRQQDEERGFPDFSDFPSSPWQEFTAEIRRVYNQLDKCPSMVDRTVAGLEVHSLTRDCNALADRPRFSPSGARRHEVWRDWWSDVEEMCGPEAVFPEYRLVPNEAPEASADNNESSGEPSFEGTDPALNQPQVDEGESSEAKPREVQTLAPMIESRSASKSAVLSVAKHEVGARSLETPPGATWELLPPNRRSEPGVRVCRGNQAAVELWGPTLVRLFRAVASRPRRSVKWKEVENGWDAPLYTDAEHASIMPYGRPVRSSWPRVARLIKNKLEAYKVHWDSDGKGATWNPD